MLRFRLYIGMLPVVALLAIGCLYTLWNYRDLNDRFERLQSQHYTVIRETEKIVLTATQLERSLLLLKEGQESFARRGYERSREILSEWIAMNGSAGDRGVQEGDSQTFFLYVRNLLSLAESAFGEQVSVYPEASRITNLVQSVEETGMALIAFHNAAISQSAQELRVKSKHHFYIVIAVIVASVVLMGFVAYSLSQRILAPIDALTEVASRLGEGDDDIEYEPSSRDEIARLEYAFVEMKDRIREYKRVTSRQIVRTRRRMEECFNNLPNPVLFLNSDRHIAYLNPAAVALVQRGSVWTESLMPQLESRIDTVFGTGEEIVVTDFDETVAAKVDNEMQHFLPIFVRVDSDDVGMIECGIVLQNVTRLRLSDELKSDLVATVSHEIKTPVTSAMMALHLVMERSLGELNEDQDDMIRTAVADLNRLKRLLDHLLEIARLEAKGPALNLSEVTPRHIVESVSEGFAMSAQSKQIVLETLVPDGLPKVNLDLKAVEVGISNYVSNAIKYSPPGSTVVTYAEVRDRRLRIGVRDEGPGLPEEDLQRVFDKFYRSSRHSKLDGIGLGLSIVREIAHAHGGYAGCERRDEVGCDFYMEFEC